MIWFFFISWQLIIKLIRSKSLFLWYSFTFNVVITHEIITFQDICMYKIPKDFTSTKDTYYAALRECFVIYYTERHYSLIKIKEDMAFENFDYAISRKLEVRFLKCLQNRTQRPWFQDNFSINIRKLFVVKVLIAELNSYLYGVFLL